MAKKLAENLVQKFHQFHVEYHRYQWIKLYKTFTGQNVAVGEPQNIS